MMRKYDLIIIGGGIAGISAAIYAKRSNLNVLVIEKGAIGGLLNNIDKIKNLIPDWIKFEYIKALFLMPGGYAGHGGSAIKSNYKKL